LDQIDLDVVEVVEVVVADAVDAVTAAGIMTAGTVATGVAYGVAVAAVGNTV
jgi:hypothetical protein